MVFQWRNYVNLEAKSPEDAVLFERAMDRWAQAPEAQEGLRKAFGRYGTLQLSGTGKFTIDGKPVDLSGYGGGYASLEPREDGSYAAIIFINLDTKFAYRAPDGSTAEESLVELLGHEFYHLADPNMHPLHLQKQVQESISRAAYHALIDVPLDPKIHQEMAEELATMMRRELDVDMPRPSARDMELYDLPRELLGMLGGLSEEAMKYYASIGMDMDFTHTPKEMAAILARHFNLPAEKVTFNYEAALRAFIQSPLYMTTPTGLDRNNHWYIPAPMLEENANDANADVMTKRFGRPKRESYSDVVEGTRSLRDIPLPEYVVSLKLPCEEFSPQNLGNASLSATPDKSMPSTASGKLF